MKRIRFSTAACLLALLVGPLPAAASGGLEAALRQVVEDNLAAYNSEDPSRTLASVHTKSPAYATMQEALPAQFSALDARTELEGFTYIGHDNEFAVARVQYRTVGETTEPFMDNILDTMTFFYQEDGAWKYWDNYVLGARLSP
ncbi:MAG: hypothetical protein K9L70_10615 [Thiohalocapsa sp.]|nr:hypothetical protein [Thiohalocapsa sp.]MCF7991531.1 hypothetical protein [Thiohalocapsa sp.]